MEKYQALRKQAGSIKKEVTKVNINVSDPIADMLTRIRNAGKQKHQSVDVPYSKVKNEIAKILLNEGYVSNVEKRRT